MDAEELRDALIKLQYSKVKFRYDPNDDWQKGYCKSIKAGSSYISSSDIKILVGFPNNQKTVSVPFDPQWLKIEGIRDGKEEEYEEEMKTVQYMNYIASLLSSGGIDTDQYSTLAISEVVDEYKDKDFEDCDFAEIADNFEEQKKGKQRDSEQSESNNYETEDLLMDVAIIIKLSNREWVGLDMAGNITTNVEDQKSSITDKYNVGSTTSIGDGVYYCIPSSADDIGVDRESVEKNVT